MDIPSQDEFREFLKVGQRIWLQERLADGSTKLRKNLVFEGYYAAADVNFMIVSVFSGEGRKAQITGSYGIRVDNIVHLAPAEVQV